MSGSVLGDSPRTVVVACLRTDGWVVLGRVGGPDDQGAAVSLNVVEAHLTQGAVVGAVHGDFTPPGPASFWQPIVGNGAWALTRPSIVLILTVGALAWFFLAVSRRLSIVPSKRQWMAEGVYNFVRNGIGRDVIGSKDFKPFVPLLFTLFTLILVNNLMEITPVVQFPTLSRIGVPIALTGVVYVTYHAVGIRRRGGFLRWTKSMVPPGLPVAVLPLMYILELFKYFVVQPVTLSLRIFGNMFAGHLLLVIFALGGEYLLIHGSNLFLNVSGVISFLVFILLTFFEVLICFLQAFIFTLLSALYIADAVSEGH